MSLDQRFYFILSLFFFAQSLSYGAEKKEQLLSLRSAIDSVFTSNPSLKAVQEKLSQTQDSTAGIKSLLYPTVEAQVTAYQKKDSVGGGKALFDGKTYQEYASNIKLTQTLFKIGSLSGISAAEKNSQISQLDLDIVRRNLIGSVIQGYYQIILYAKNVETLNHQQKLVGESLKVAQERAKIGRGQRLDVLQIKTQAALLDGQISEARNQLQVATANLAYLMSDHNEQSFRLKSILNTPSVGEIDQNVNLKNYNIPELQKDILSLEQIYAQKRTALGEHLPSLEFIGNYSFSSYKKEDLYDPLQNSWYLGLQLTIPIFSGLSSFHEQSEFSSKIREQEFRNKSNQDTVYFNQVTSRKKLETAFSSITTGEEALKLATASYNEAKKNYRYATIDFFQFLSVQQAYLQAEQSLNSDKFNYIVAVTNYFISSGQDLDKLVTVLERETK